MSTMIRRFKVSDAEQTAGVWLRAGLEEYDYLPDFQKLTPASALHVFNTVIAEENEIWLYELDNCVAGFLAMQGSYIDRLYVEPTQQRKGIGRALLEHALTLSPLEISLHTHQQNTRARSFYEKFGFRPVKFDLSPPPECVPDVEYHWTRTG